MSANTGFSLSAAAGSLLISVASGVKGRWEVAIVFGLLVIGFLFRASEGWRARRRDARTPSPPSAPARGAAEHEPERQLSRTRFKRR